MNNESKGYGRKWPGLNLRLLSSNLLERTRKIHETRQYIYDVLAEILIRHLPNANRKLCHVN